MISMTALKQVWFRLRYRRILRRHGLVVIPTERLEQLYTDGAAVMIAEIEAELFRASGAAS